ncbi:MAG: hypothetical protein MMC23_002695 [Stictis urceolatum]|nr:hypothetical protein [Stictis urceolata]
MYHIKRPRRDANLVARLVNGGRLAEEAEQDIKYELDLVFQHKEYERPTKKELGRRGTPPQSPSKSLANLRITPEEGKSSSEACIRLSQLVSRKPGEDRELRILGEMLLSHFAATVYLKSDQPIAPEAEGSSKEENEGSDNDGDIEDITPPPELSEAGQQLAKFKIALEKWQVSPKASASGSGLSLQGVSRKASSAGKLGSGSKASASLKGVQRRNAKK